MGGEEEGVLVAFVTGPQKQTRHHPPLDPLEESAKPISSTHFTCVCFISVGAALSKGRSRPADTEHLPCAAAAAARITKRCHQRAIWVGT